MARAKHRQHSTALARWKPATRTAKPIVIRTTVVKKPKHRRHHRGGGGFGIGGLVTKDRLGIAAGAFGLAVLEKQNVLSSLPAIPVIGKTGTIALGAYLLSGGGKNRLASDICTAALALVAYQLGTTGTVVGSELPPEQVGYVAGF
jgi:hypothetical protein